TAAGFMNASVGFDVPTLAPTYRLLLGVPGGSSALDIAGWIGLDEPILEQAVETLTREAQGREARRLDQMLADVQAAQRHVEEDRAAAATLRERPPRFWNASARRSATNARGSAASSPMSCCGPEPRFKKSWMS